MKRFLLKAELLGLHIPDEYKAFFIDATRPDPKSATIQVHVLFVRCRDEGILRWCERRCLVQLNLEESKLLRTGNGREETFQHIWKQTDDLFVWLNVAVAHDIDISNPHLYSVQDTTRSKRRR